MFDFLLERKIRNYHDNSSFFFVMVVVLIVFIHIIIWQHIFICHSWYRYALSLVAVKAHLYPAILFCSFLSLSCFLSDDNESCRFFLAEAWFYTISMQWYTGRKIDTTLMLSTVNLKLQFSLCLYRSNVTLTKAHEYKTKREETRIEFKPYTWQLAINSAVLYIIVN